MKSCLVCGVSIKNRNKFCSNVCQKLSEHIIYINKWKKGILDGNRGIVSKNISAHIKRYLIQNMEKNAYYVDGIRKIQLH